MQGVRKFSKAPTSVGFLPEPSPDHPECVVCKAFLYLHAVGCSAAPGRYCCAHHAHALCDLPPSKWTLHYRFSIFELRGIEKVCSCVLGALFGPSNLWAPKIQSQTFVRLLCCVPQSSHGCLRRMPVSVLHDSLRMASVMASLRCSPAILVNTDAV